MRTLWFTPSVHMPAWQWAETVGFTIVGMLLGYWIQPDDPFFVISGFPWIWLVPVLLALRYGVLSGVMSTTMILAAWFIGQGTGMLPGIDFPKLHFLGGLIFVMICGEYSGLWRTRLRRAEEVSNYLDEQLDLLTKKHFLLRLSHDRLEQNLISRPVTLRDALKKLIKLMAGRAPDEALPAAREFLELLAQYCQLTVVAMYPVEQDQVHPKAAAEIGGNVPLRLDDPLLTFCIQQKELAHINTLEAEQTSASQYLVVAPIQRNTREWIGLLVVQEMPFFAFQQETMQMLTALLGYYADSVFAAHQVRPLQTAYPDCPLDFAQNLVKLTRIQNESLIDTAVVALLFRDDPQSEGLYQQVKRMRRELDMLWEVRQPGKILLLTLMPLSGNEAADGYVGRIELWLKESYQQDFVQAGIMSHIVTLEEHDSVKLLNDLFKRCGN